MSKSVKNLIVVLGIVTVVFVGYSFFTQEAALVLRTPESNEQLAELQRSADEFAARQRILNEISIDTRILDSSEFQSLRAFSPEPQEFEIGRPDPFLPTEFDQGRTNP